MAADAAYMPETQQVRAFGMCLPDSMRAWYRDARKWVDALHPEQQWEALARSFIEKHGVRQERGDIVSLWVNSGQRERESVEQYATRRQELEQQVRELSNDEWGRDRELESMHYFRRGLRAGLKEALGLHEPASMQELIRLVKVAEGRINQDRGSVETQPGRAGTGFELLAAQLQAMSDKMEVRDEERRVRDEERKVEMEQLQQQLQQQEEQQLEVMAFQQRTQGSGVNGGGAPAQYQRRCHECNEVGHLRRDCPVFTEKMTRLRAQRRSTLECYRCGEMGHITRDCTIDPNDCYCRHCKRRGHTDKACQVRRRMLGGGAGKGNDGSSGGGGAAGAAGPAGTESQRD